MKKIRLLVSVLLCMVMMVGVSACGCSTQNTEDKGNKTNTNNTAINNTNATDTSTTNGGKETLVVYFSATGTTRGVAEKIAKVTNADIYEITAAEPYSDADLDWHDNNSRSTKEQNDSSVRPTIGSAPISLDGYKTIYIGYPIWWGEEPRIMDTFVEANKFDGKTVIPFCTSGGSGIGKSGKNLEKLAGAGNWLSGGRLNGSDSENDIKSWVEKQK